MLEEEFGKLKKEVLDLTTTNAEKKKLNVTPIHNIVTISDDDNGNDRIPCTAKSLYHRKSGKGKCKIEERNELSNCGKRLFNAPTSSEKPIKKSRGSTSTSPTVKRFCKKILTQASKPKGHTIPKEVKTCFRPTLSMDHTWEESRVSAYIFNDQLDLKEDLFMIGDETATHREFLSLATGTDINDKIFALLAKLRTHVERHGDAPITTWYLPPSFSVEVLLGKCEEEIITKYMILWMPPSADLKYIYVSIVEDNVHWYLMVVDIDDYIIYKLDTWDMKCYRQRRHSDITKLAFILDKVLDQPHYERQMTYFPKMLSTWEIKNGEGQPNLWNSYMMKL